MKNLTRSSDYYELRKFVLIREGQNDLDISGIIPELYITESMDNDCIRGSAKIFDKISVLHDLPIRGEERILIEVSDAEDQIQKYDMFLYKVDNIETMDSNDGMEYMIHFCSFSRFLSSMRRVCKSYNAYIHEIVRDIFNETYDVSSFGYQPITNDNAKLSEPSNTDSLQHVIVPNMFPHQAMDFLTRRAYSNALNSSSFRFYQNTRGYHFLNDEDTFKRSPEPMTMTFYDSPISSGLAFKEIRHNIIDMQNVKRINTVNDLASGAYSNEVVEIDLIKKEVVSKPFSYLEDVIDYSRPSGIRSELNHSMDFANKFFNGENAKRFMVIRTNKAETMGSLDPDDHMSDLISSKVAYRYHLDKMQISAVAPGHLNLTCGDLVELRVYDMQGQKDIVNQNPRMSGTYLVRSIERQFVRDGYKDILQLSRAKWEDRNQDELSV